MTPDNKTPNDPPLSDQLARMIRVNHAGEYGARRIYEGQLEALKGTPYEGVLSHMKEQELKHLQAFEDLLHQRRVRPTFLSPIWHGLGYLLGYATGRMGPQAAMACTVAVEEVIDEHYAEQERYLEKIPAEKDLKDLIQQFRQEELEHRDIGLAQGALDAPAYPLLTGAIKAASRLAIWLSKRL